MFYRLLSDKNSCNNCLNDSYLALRPPKNASCLFSDFNYVSPDINNTPEKVINSKYYDINQLPTLKEFTDKSSLSLFHVNICSLLKNIDDLEHLTQSVNTGFDISMLFRSQR